MLKTETGLSAALYVASLGLRVFPLRPGAKIPRITGWQAKATTDEWQIRQWWTEWPDANVGYSTDDLTVVDLDPRNSGDKTWAALEGVDHNPDTLTIKSAQGGRHYVFRNPPGVKVRSRAHALGIGVDIKGAGGLAVGPGSTWFGLEYAVLHDHPILETPAWLLAKVKLAGPKGAKTEPAGERLVDEDDEARNAAITFLQHEAPPAIQGNGGNQQTYDIACWCGDLGCGPETTTDLMLDWYNPKCVPPWDVFELKYLISNAFLYRYHPIGRKHPKIASAWSEDIKDEPTPSEAPRQQLIKTSGQFVKGFTPPDYTVVGLMVRRFIYSLTGQTSAGKTCITLLLAASVALGKTFAGCVTKKCRVLYCAAENPDDVRMRWIALAQEMGFDASNIEVYFTEDTFTISALGNQLRQEAEAFGGEFGLVIVDTGPAFFEGDDESNRVQMGKHARMLRGLIKIIPGLPTVLVNVHPVKNATADNLLPAGGGTFLNEVDGNFTAARSDSVTELHWQGKIRGPEFSPKIFVIRTVTHPKLKDSDGRLLPTVICDGVTEGAKEEMAAAGHREENDILRLIHDNPTASLSALATMMGWKLHGGDPNKMRAKRRVDALKRDRLVEETRGGGMSVTEKGKKAMAES